jgi:RNA polymerase sigma-70 factor (ECF subfamily)
LSKSPESIAEAWAAFYLANRRGLSTYALALTGNQADAQDLVQDVLVRMVRRKHHARAARAYVMRCLRNLAIDRHRQSRARPPEAPLEGDGVAFIDTSAATDGDTLEQVRAALRSLPAQRREVVVLKVYAELSFREIAEVLEIPAGTAASHYARALDELRQLLAAEERYV